MRAVRIHAPGGPDALVLEEAPYPGTTENDVVLRVRAAGFTRGELGWPSTWKDRAGHDRAPVIPGHEVSGEGAELGQGTTGLTVGQRVFGLTDWARDGTLAEYVGVEARNLAPLPATIDHVHGAALAMPGLTAWQALFDHGGLLSGQTVLVHGAAGAVGDMAVQLARDAGADIIGARCPRDLLRGRAQPRAAGRTRTPGAPGQDHAQGRRRPLAGRDQGRIRAPDRRPRQDDRSGRLTSVGLPRRGRHRHGRLLLLFNEQRAFPQGVWKTVCATPAKPVARAVGNCGLGVHNPEPRDAHVRKHLCMHMRHCG